MCTRGIWQLKTMTFQYCAHSGSSRGIKELFGSQAFVDFATRHPQLQIRSELRPGRHPVLLGDYVDDAKKHADLKNMYGKDILYQMERMVNTSGRKMTKVKSPIRSKRMSIQGVWQPGVTDGVDIKGTHHL